MNKYQIDKISLENRTLFSGHEINTNFNQPSKVLQQTKSTIIEEKDSLKANKLTKGSSLMLTNETKHLFSNENRNSQNIETMKEKYINKNSLVLPTLVKEFEVYEEFDTKDN